MPMPGGARKPRADRVAVRLRAATSGDRAQAPASPGLGAGDGDKVQPLANPSLLSASTPDSGAFFLQGMMRGTLLQRALPQSATECAHLAARAWFSRHVCSQPSDGSRHVGSAAGALQGKPKPIAGTVMPVDRIAALEEYQRAMQECLLDPA